MKKIVLMAVVIFSMVGCSSRLAYNNLDWLADWYLGDFIDLTSSQQKVFENKLNQVLVWHRQVELVKYRDQLILLQTQNQQGVISAQKWSLHLQTLADHWQRIRNKVSGDMASMAPSLSKDQVSHFFAALAQNNEEKRKEFLELSAQEAQEERFDDIVEKFEERLGSLRSSQEDIIHEYVNASNKTPLIYIAYSERFQLSLKQTFEQDDPVQLSKRLYEVMIHPEQFKTADSINLDKKEQTLLVNMLEKMNLSQSKKQRRHFEKEIQELIDMMEELMGDKS
ncbi:MAG: DUF6279 family lipoprotein [Bermanella sp.]